MRGLRWLGVLLGVVGLLAGCARAERPPAGDDVIRENLERTAWFRPCPVAPSPAPSPVRGPQAMPAITLDCFGDGQWVDLAVPPGVPTVVNVWASWCRPCREELPVFEAYAVRAGDRVRVLGVVSGDTKDAAFALAKELRVKFPTMWDEDATLIKALGRNALPVTLFIAADGRLVHVHQGKPFDDAGLADAVADRLGVRL